MNTPDFAMLIAAVAKQGDPLTRFVSSLPEELARYAEETIRLQAEFVEHSQALLTTEPCVATLHAEWLTRHAHEVAYRWAGLRESALRWAQITADGTAFRVTPVRTSTAGKK